MDYRTFIRNVCEASGGSEQQAENAAHETLRVLAGRLEEGEASDLAAQLPQELAETVKDVAPRVDKVSLEQFYDRVSAAAEVRDRREAERFARAVVGTMSEAITQGELRDVFAQLPGEYHDLFTARSV